MELESGGTPVLIGKMDAKKEENLRV